MSMTTRPQRRRRPATLLAGLCCGLAACSATPVDVVLVYPSVADYDAAEAVLLDLGSGQSCATVADHATLSIRFKAHDEPPSVGDTPAGRTAFRAQVTDRDCWHVLDGCAEVDLRQGAMPVRIALASVTPVAGCSGPQNCEAGLCVGGGRATDVECGSHRCGEDPLCCLDTMLFTASCSTGCAGMTFACDDASDCFASEECCGVPKSGYTETRCVPRGSCASAGVRACQSPTECGGSEDCCGDAALNAFGLTRSFCRPSGC